MTILGKEPAIGYLSRLTPLRYLDQAITSPFSQHKLLFTLLEIQKAVLTSRPENDSGTQLEIAPHGFPHLPLLLLDIKLAFAMQKENLDQSKKNASLLLDAITNLAQDQFIANRQGLQKSQQINLPVVQALSGLSPSQIEYLKEICQKPADKLPLTTPKDSSGILLAKIHPTPFYDKSYPDNKSADRLFFRKYFDAPNFPGLPVVYGSKDHPLESDQKWPEIRFPAIAYGTTNQEGEIDHRSTITPKAEAYAKTGGDGLIVLDNGGTMTIKNTDRPGSIHHLTDLSPKTEHQIGNIFNKAIPKELQQSFLSIDFANLSDTAADHILDSLPAINDYLQKVLQVAHKIVDHQPTPEFNTWEMPKNFIGLINSISDPAAKDAIHRAIKTVLAETKFKLTGENH